MINITEDIVTRMKLLQLISFFFIFVWILLLGLTDINEIAMAVFIVFDIYNIVLCDYYLNMKEKYEEKFEELFTYIFEKSDLRYIFFNYNISLFKPTTMGFEAYVEEKIKKEPAKD